jgi:hypothetical protein
MSNFLFSSINDDNLLFNANQLEEESVLNEIQETNFGLETLLELQTTLLREIVKPTSELMTLKINQINEQEELVEEDLTETIANSITEFGIVADEITSSVNEIPANNEFLDLQREIFFEEYLPATFVNLDNLERLNNISNDEDLIKINELNQNLYKFESLYNQILIDILNIITLLKEKNFSELEDNIKNNVFFDLAIKLLDEENFIKDFNNSYNHDTNTFTKYKDIIFEFLNSLSITININQSTNNILNEYYKFREILYNDQKLNLWVMHRQSNTDLDIKANISSDVKVILNEPYNTYFSRYGNLLLGYIDHKLMAEIILELGSE